MAVKAPRRPRRVLKPSKMDSARAKTYNSTFLLVWTPSGVRMEVEEEEEKEEEEPHAKNQLIWTKNGREIAV